MSKNARPSVNITNRPSNRGSHTSMEWAEHIGIRESRETKRDIVDARSRLGQFTARFVIEAMCAGEQDGADLARRMLELVDPDQRVDEMSVDPRELKKLAMNVGGAKAAHVVNNSVLREVADEPVQTVPTKAPDVGQQQVELLRALLKTMDPEVVKRALTGG